MAQESNLGQMSFKLRDLSKIFAQFSESALDFIVPHNIVENIVLELKSGVDSFRFRDPQVSLSLSDAIILLGHGYGDKSIEALGHMARGDTLAHLERTSDAWAELKTAEAMFLKAEDEVGWARTRIGLIHLAANRSTTERIEITATLDDAHQILIENGFSDKSLVLSSNTAIAYDLLGEHEQALETYLKILEKVLQLDEPIKRLYLGMTYSNLAVTYEYLGKGHIALDYRRLATETYEEYEQWDGVIRETISNASMLTRQGRFYVAIKDLHRMLATSLSENEGQKNVAYRHLAECYLSLGRNNRSLLLVDEILPFFVHEQHYHEAVKLHILKAISLANLGHYDEALRELSTAENYTTQIDAQFQMGRIHWRRAQIFLVQGRILLADNEADFALQQFPLMKNQHEHASVILTKVACRIQLEQTQDANDLLERLHWICQQEYLPEIEYKAHILQAKLELKQGQQTKAKDSLQSAIDLIAYLQEKLTLTLRPSFLQSRTEAHNLLTQIYLQDKQAASALETIERIRSQVYMTYMLDYDHIYWTETEANQPLIEELNLLRSQYHILSSAIGAERKPNELEITMTRIEDIREQLYLSSHQTPGMQSFDIPKWQDIQPNLLPNELILTYYTDQNTAYLIAGNLDQDPFILELGNIAVIQRFIRQCYLGINTVLNQPLTMNQERHTKQIQIVLQKLYDLLLRPLFEQNKSWSSYRVFIVPYGALHQVPFACLHDGNRYFVQATDIAILPNIGWIAQRHRVSPSGQATVLGHSDDNRIPRRVAEATFIADLLKTDSHLEDQALPQTFQRTTGTILHIAAHAEFILSEPELSHIQLGAGRWYIDDLLQNKMAYQLVTLSACETGGAVVAPGDELIGLGHGFLFSGSDAVIASLWQVEDTNTDRLMTTLYKELVAGKDKSQALAYAQRSLLADNPDLHPTLWGAWQMIGNPKPISWD